MKKLKFYLIGISFAIICFNTFNFVAASNIDEHFNLLNKKTKRNNTEYVEQNKDSEKKEKIENSIDVEENTIKVNSDTANYLDKYTKKSVFMNISDDEEEEELKIFQD